MSGLPLFVVTQETDALGDQRSFAYDAGGNLSRYTDGNGRVRDYQYDAAGQVSSETWYADGQDADNTQSPVNSIVYQRDSNGRITSESDNQSSDSYTYDAAGDILTATEALPNGPTVVLAYQYNAASQRTQMAATIDGTADFVDDYVYDSLGRVTSVHQHGVTGGDSVADVEIDIAYNTANEITSIDRYQDGVLAVEN